MGERVGVRAVRKDHVIGVRPAAGRRIGWPGVPMTGCHAAESVVFSRDGKQIVSAGDDFRWHSGDVLRPGAAGLEAHAGAVKNVAFSVLGSSEHLGRRRVSALGNGRSGFAIRLVACAAAALLAALTCTVRAAADSGPLRGCDVGCIAASASRTASGGQARLPGTVPLDEPAVPEVVGTTWRFVEVMGAATPMTTAATLGLLSNGAAVGFSGCNHFVGRYELDGAILTFTELSYTKKMCDPDVMRVEFGVQAALDRTRSVTGPPGQLYLLASEGTTLARLVAP
ncbi:hypothetical protein LAUMK4_01618 [Mycobacterium persicum]|uniref:DUF306 domain-containing protein n=2 Tax=Mycobacterium persicum TaxID=1487726 RepID=A0ABY6RFR6_9MYCO|nr:META domain-containing protein [Mycobacterium persicum]VAZ73869.1 hypothetical protein LAUMK15_01982 [Mycobacterium persicum]VAZ91054.1 hypothetical protein LAUMK4_01618 [Mycobacterium persicum]